MDKINRASIISSKPLDFEIPLLQLKEITLKSKTLSPRTKPQTLEKFLQIELKNNQKSIVTYLQNIQTSETIAKTNPRGSICSRYSRNKESVSQLFSLLKPERVKSSIFMKKIETSEGYQTSLKDTLLTNEQLIEVSKNI